MYSSTDKPEYLINNKIKATTPLHRWLSTYPRMA